MGAARVASYQRSDEERLADQRYFGNEWAPTVWLMKVLEGEIGLFPDEGRSPEVSLLEYLIANRDQEYFDELRGRRRQFLREMRRDQTEFRRGHENHWRNALDLLEIYIFNAIELLVTIEKRLDDARARSEPVVTAMMRLAYRATLIAREVAWLLRGGFPEGALGRWRTLHEVAVTASLARLEGHELARRILMHEVLQTLDFNEARRKEAGPEGTADPDYAEEQQLRAELLAEFGPSFANRYGWAVAAVGKARPTFEQIEAAAGMAPWRRAYADATYASHSTSRPLHNELLERHGEDVIAPTSNGLATPAIMTARSLHQVNCAVLGLFTTSADDLATDLRTSILLDVFAREVMEEFAAHEWPDWGLTHPGQAEG